MPEAPRARHPARARPLPLLSSIHVVLCQMPRGGGGEGRIRAPEGRAGEDAGGPRAGQTPDRAGLTPKPLSPAARSAPGQEHPLLPAVGRTRG